MFSKKHMQEVFSTIAIPVVIITLLVVGIGAGIRGISQWNSSKVTSENAQEILQQLVDLSPHYEGTVSSVWYSAPTCTQIQFGNSCKIDLIFDLDDTPMSAICTYGITFFKGSHQTCLINP